MLPPAYNFASLPQVGDREPLRADPELPARLARGEGYLGAPDGMIRESLAVDIATGAPEHHVVYPGNTHLPIVLAAVTGLFFLALLLKILWVAPLAMIGVAVLGWRWVWVLGRREDLGAVPVGRGLSLPTIAEVDRPPGWWGSVFLLVADATLFGSLLFGYAFLWTIAPGWPPPAWIEPSVMVMALAGIGVALSIIGPFFATRANAGGNSPIAGLALSLAGSVAIAAALVAMLAMAPSATGHAYGATLLVLGGYGILHAIILALMAAFLIARVRAGYTSPRRRAELAILPIWGAYCGGASVVILLAAYLPVALT